MVLVESSFLRDEEHSLGFRLADIAVIHAFFEGFRVSPDAAWIEIKSLFFGLVILVWTVDLADFKIPTCRIFFTLSFFFSCINIVDSSFYRMYVLIQFVLLCQTLSDLRTGYS